jgi:predicted DsbA family dithiol-disulfide isomerase
MMNTSSAGAVRVDVWSDFVCPFCYIGTLRLAQLDRQQPLDIHWHAFQLRPAGSPPMDDAKRRMIAEHTPKLAQQMRTEFGIVIERGPLEIDTRAAHRLYACALRSGKGPQVHDALLRAYWLDAKDISSETVLNAIATEAGFDGRGAIDGRDAPSDQAVASDLAQAAQFGFNGVPAIVFGNRYYVNGAQPLDVLLQAAQTAARAA